MKERNEWLKNYLVSLYEELNSEYPGIVSIDSVNEYYDKLSTSKYSKEELTTMIDQNKERVIKHYLNNKSNMERISQEKLYELNDLFNCRVSNDTLHIHVVPVSIKKELAEMGLKKYLEFAEVKLLDAFSKIYDILCQDENNDIKTVFAVSPLLRVSIIQDLFRKFGFDAGLTDSELFKSMFNSDRVGQAIISKEKFMTLEKERRGEKYIEK